MIALALRQATLWKPSAVGMVAESAEEAMMETWRRCLATLDYAFQPIVVLRTGQCHGFEALLRGVQHAGFGTIQSLLDHAHGQGVLSALEAALRAKAIAKFRALGGHAGIKLFLNVDARVFNDSEHWPCRDDLGAPGNLSVCLEVSEQKEVRPVADTERVFDRYRRAGFDVALDDFGVGFAGLKLLYEAKPDYVKIDRFFVDGIDRDMRKRTMVSYVVSYAHTLGIQVVAEGVETEAEFHACRDLGCDLVQGYLVASPAVAFDGGRLPDRIAAVETLDRRDRRAADSDRRRLQEVADLVPPLRVDTPKAALLDYFSRGSSPEAAPVLDAYDRPLGLIRERDLKRYLYSRYGGELLRNKALAGNLKDLVIPCPISDVDSKLERVIETFSNHAASDGIILTEGGRYVGFLGVHCLVRLVHEKNLATAVDQNPLTKLPGNGLIADHIEKVLLDRDRRHVLVYLDFDNFKPFNDTFGFRQGDRAILMFAEMLKAEAAVVGGFAGHIGGDDFFLGLGGVHEDDACALLTRLVGKFRLDAESLYDPASRAAGAILGKDRDGNPRHFPLLSVSGVAVGINPESGVSSPEAIIAAIARHKNKAKLSADKLCYIDL